MRHLLFLILCFAAFSCNNGDTTHRSSYVISKAHETAVDDETVTESPAD